MFAAEEIAEVFRALITSTEANAAKAVLERPFMERIMSMPPESLATHSGSQVRCNYFTKSMFGNNWSSSVWVTLSRCTKTLC